MLIPDILPIVHEVMTDLQAALRKSQAAQGHTLTGRLSKSTDFVITSTDKTITAQMFMEGYGLNVEFGVKANRIPFSGVSGKGGTSQYIQGLITYFKLRGLSERESKGAAFATAYVQSREGMPTRGSFRFSTTGERTGFIRAAIEQEQKSIFQKIEKNFGVSLEIIFANNFRVLENVTIKI